MPKIIEYFGLIFYFYANEHEPIHVHVSYAEFETVFELIFSDGILLTVGNRNVRGINPLPKKQQQMAERVVKEFANDIATKWMEFFVLNKKPEIIKVTKKL